MPVNFSDERKRGASYRSWDLKVKLDPRDLKERFERGMQDQIFIALKEAVEASGSTIDIDVIQEAATELSPGFVSFLRSKDPSVKETIVVELRGVEQKIVEKSKGDAGQQVQFDTTRLRQALDSVPKAVLGTDL